MKFIHPRMKILSRFTHPQVEFISSAKQKKAAEEDILKNVRNQTVVGQHFLP